MQPDQMDARTAAAVQREVERLDAQWRERMQQAVNDVTLRKWCVERATAVSTPDAVKLASELHSFITGAFAVTER
jgi:hypothetical protein